MMVIICRIVNWVQFVSIKKIICASNYGLLVCFCQLHEILVKYAVCGQLSDIKLAIHLTPHQREVKNGVFESCLHHDFVHLWELCTYTRCRVAKVELFNINKNDQIEIFNFQNCLAILMKLLKFKVYGIPGWMDWQSREVWVCTTFEPLPCLKFIHFTTLLKTRDLFSQPIQVQNYVIFNTTFFPTKIVSIIVSIMMHC